jgi:hypothetical protein
MALVGKSIDEKKYGIKVRAIRANSTELAVKVLNESRAGKPQSDLIDGTSTVVPLKRRAMCCNGYRTPRAVILCNTVTLRDTGSRATCIFSRPASTPASSRKEPSRVTMRRCSTRNGAGKWPGARPLPVRAALASSAPC